MPLCPSSRERTNNLQTPDKHSPTPHTRPPASFPAPPEPVAVFGAGGHAATVVTELCDAGYRVSGVFDDDPRTHGTHLLGFEVLGPPEAALASGLTLGVIAIGDNWLRRSLAQRITDLTWLTFIHPRAYVARSAQIGPGTLVMLDAVVRPRVVVGAHAIINTKAVVGHDCVIGDFAHIAGSTHMGGGSAAEDGAFLGMGTIVVPEKRIGSWSTVGAGGVVVKDIPPNVVAVGVPAVPIKHVKGRD